MDMVKLAKYQGFSADTAAAACLLLSSLTGIPVSTTHTKTTAIMGVGSSHRFSSVKWSVVSEDGAGLGTDFPRLWLDRVSHGQLFIQIF